MPLIINSTRTFSLSLDELLDIKVEARKVLEDLQLTPLAVSALSGQQLLLGGHNSLLDASYFFAKYRCDHGRGELWLYTLCQYHYTWGRPGRPHSHYLSQCRYLCKRGLPGSFSGGIVRFLDIDHLEVLRGPQGTLFVKNTIGGAVQVFTNKVAKQQSLSVKADMGSISGVI